MQHSLSRELFGKSLNSLLVRRVELGPSDDLRMALGRFVADDVELDLSDIGDREIAPAHGWPSSIGVAESPDMIRLKVVNAEYGQVVPGIPEGSPCEPIDLQFAPVEDEA